MALVDDVRTFDRFARLYDLLMPAARPERFTVGLEYATRPLERGLDLGGGTGRVASAFPALAWTVVDAAPGAVAVARDHGFDGVVGDATRLPIRDDAVDAIVVADALHHIRRPHTVAAEAERVLRPGGVLVVHEFDPGTLRGTLVTVGERLVGFESEFYAPEAVADAFESAGLAPFVADRSGMGYTVAGRKSGEK